jgi:predicted AlkP superfamily pyrophosphatase or phosphodiesterase
MRIARSLLLVAAFIWLGLSIQAQPLVIVLVIDGFRPDSIDPGVTPNLFRLRQEGTWCANAHSVFPTVTRVNSSTISTGTIPSAHGIVSNVMYVEGVSPKPFDTSNYRNLIKLAEISNGRTLAVTTLAETLQAAGISFVAISSGSTGGAFLLNPKAPDGTGILINGGFEDGHRVAFPDKVDREIQSRFGTQMSDIGPPSLLWTERVLRDYVLPEIRPRVVIDWLTEPDTTQHRTGVGSPDSLAVLRTMDQQVGLLTNKLREIGLGNTTDIIVTADHGFAAEPDPVDLNAMIQATGEAGKVIVASNGASVFLYAKDHDAEVIRKIVLELQKSDDVDLVFTNAQAPKNATVECRPGREVGWVPGTFSLELVDQCRTTGAADVIVTFRWTSDKNAFGFPGSQKIASTDARRNVPARSGHGGLNPWMIHTPMILWGPDFKKQTVVQAPVANFDIAPTILALAGVQKPGSMSGRVIAEALVKSKRENSKVRPVKVQVRSGSYCASIQLTMLGHQRYIDRGERCP